MDHKLIFGIGQINFDLLGEVEERWTFLWKFGMKYWRLAWGVFQILLVMLVEMQIVLLIDVQRKLWMMFSLFFLF